MPDRIDAFDAMANDLGIHRYKGEDTTCFCRRVAYSASRPWISAYCLDDGAEGKAGLTKQGINRRLRAWIEALDDIHPGMRKWFMMDEDGLPEIYNRLIDLGDIIPNGFSGSYTAHTPTILPVCDGYALIVGFIDATSNANSVCGIDRREIVTSGLVSVTKSESLSPNYQSSWWETELEYLPWNSAKDLGELEYANLKCKSTRWSLRHNDAWCDKPMLVDGLTLARPTHLSVGEPQYFVCRSVGRSLYLSRINWLMAQEFFFYLRMHRGNPATAAYQFLDDKHVRLAIPSTIVPGQYSRVLDSIAWPVDDVRGRGTLIVRTEAMSMVRELIDRSYFALREIEK